MNPDKIRKLSAISAWATGAAMLVAIAAYRLYGAWQFRYSDNMDYGIVVKMSQHIASGQGWPAFFYGQGYMGSLEPTLGALFMLFMGPTPFALSLAMFTLSGILLWRTCRWACLCGGKWAAIFAMAIAGVGSFPYFHYICSSRGGYIVGMIITVEVIAAACEIAYRCRRHGAPPSLWRIAYVGALAGIGFWTFWITVPAIAAAGCVLLIGCGTRRILKWRVICAGLGSFFIGSLPLWAWNLAHRMESFASGGADWNLTLAGAIHTARVLVRSRIVDIFDLGSPRPVQLLFLAVIAIAAGWGFARTVRKNDRFLFMAAGIAVQVLLFCGLFIGTSFGTSDTPRYLICAIPLLAAFGGAGVARCGAAFREAKGKGAKFASAALLASAVLFGFGPFFAHGFMFAGRIRDYGARCDSNQRRNRAFIEELARRGIRNAMCSYRLYGLNIASDEDVAFATPDFERDAITARRVYESDECPAVVENMRGTDDFIMSTRATARFEKLEGYRLCSEAKPSDICVSEVSPGEIKSAVFTVGADKIDVLDSTFSYDARYDEAVAFPGDDDCPLDISLRAPRKICGVRLWLENGCESASVQVRRQGEEEFTEAVPKVVNTFCYWSGPRFYCFGEFARFELRFDPVDAEAVQVVFGGTRAGRAHKLNYAQLLEPREGAVFDVTDEELKEIVQHLETHVSPRIYADSFLAEKIARVAKKDTWVSRPSKIHPEITKDDLEVKFRIRHHATSTLAGIVVPKYAADSFEARLKHHNYSYDRFDYENVTLLGVRFTIDAKRPRLLFLGELLAPYGKHGNSLPLIRGSDK